MKVLFPGHLYELANFERTEKPGQVLQFIQKQPSVGGEPGTLDTIADGTTDEEVIRMLVDRMNSLQAKFPRRENAIATTHLETALLWLEKRTSDRLKRGVEGKHLA